jgi:hypothetical protein
MNTPGEPTHAFTRNPQRRMKLPLNEGPIDRLIRIVLGSALLTVAGASWVGGPLFWVVIAFGALALMTGLTGFCPTYIPFGISTLSKRQGDAQRGR